MCLILLAWRAHPQYPLVVAANRDEFHARPAAPAAFWPAQPDVLAGRDLESGGTWLGVTRQQRFCAVTNFRDPAAHRANSRSRGALVRDYLTGTESAADFLAQARTQLRAHNGFTLLAGDSDELLCLESVTGQIHWVEPGIHGLSNHLLDTPWPKVARGRRAVQWVLDSLESPAAAQEALLDILASRVPADDWELPDTGVGIALERRLSTAFVSDRRYGTRCSTVLLRDNQGKVAFVERRFDPEGEVVATDHFTFDTCPRAPVTPTAGAVRAARRR